MAESLLTLMDEYHAWCLEESPEFSTTSGSQRHKDKLERVGLAAAAAKRTTCSAFLRRLNSIADDDLDSPGSITSKEILREDLSTVVNGYEWIHHSMCNAVYSFEIIPSTFAVLVKYVREDDHRDLVTYFRRLTEVSRLVGEQIAVLEKAVEMRTTFHKSSIAVTLSILERHLSHEPGESVFFAPFSKAKQRLSVTDNVSKGKVKDIEALSDEAITLIRSEIQPALQRLRTFLIGRYLPASRPQPGVSCLPRGLEYYRACLRCHLSADVDPKWLHELGLKEVARIKALMGKLIVVRAGFKGTAEEYIAHLKADTTLFFSTEADAVLETRAIMDDVIAPKLADYFRAVPEMTRLDLASADGGTQGGFYTPASRDGRVPGLFTLCRPLTLARYTLMPLITHEYAHHVQRAYVLARPVPSFRAERSVKYGAGPSHMPIYTAYVEGWGCYAEYLGEEMGLYRDTLEWFARHSDEMLRALRIVVDTGVHAFGWSREQAVRLMSSLTVDPQADTEAAVDRCISAPGHNAAYKFGEMKIRELRALSEKTLGNKFCIKAFHDVVLSLGPAPLFTLERVVKEWIEKQNPNGK